MSRLERLLEKRKGGKKPKRAISAHITFPRDWPLLEVWRALKPRTRSAIVRALIEDAYGAGELDVFLPYHLKKKPQKRPGSFHQAPVGDAGHSGFELDSRRVREKLSRAIEEAILL